jgi:hypothetical protein
MCANESRKIVNLPMPKIYGSAICTMGFACLYPESAPTKTRKIVTLPMPKMRGTCSANCLMEVPSIDIQPAENEFDRRKPIATVV